MSFSVLGYQQVGETMYLAAVDDTIPHIMFSIEMLSISTDEDGNMSATADVRMFHRNETDENYTDADMVSTDDPNMETYKQSVDSIIESIIADFVTNFETNNEETNQD